VGVRIVLLLVDEDIIEYGILRIRREDASTRATIGRSVT